MKKRIGCIGLFLMFFSVVNAQGESDSLSRPSYLKRGDTIVILAPSGVLKERESSIQIAKDLVEGWGLNVLMGANTFNQNNHFAGTDAERAADFQKAIDNPSVKAIWAARGGYGAVRVIDLLDFTKFKESPKWIIGYSDITAFHNHIHNLGVETIHGMMATSLEGDWKDTTETIRSLKNALFGKALRYSITSSPYNRTDFLNVKKTIEGQLIGGNLAILTSMLGSNSQVSMTGKILFIEEIGEYKYAIDRMLQSLKRAGYFKNVNAVIVGNISNIKENSTEWGSSIEELILAVVPVKIPVLFDFPAGHELDNRALIFGRNLLLQFGLENCSLVFK